MTTQELIQQGLEASKDEGAFRGWASQWFKPITGIPVLVARGWGSTLQGEPLEVWAFRAREAGGEQWGAACEKVRCVELEGPFLEIKDPMYPLSVAVSLRWMAEFCSACHWIIAGCAALEMQKEVK